MHRHLVIGNGSCAVANGDVAVVPTFDDGVIKGLDPIVPPCYYPGTISCNHMAAREFQLIAPKSHDRNRPLFKDLPNLCNAGTLCQNFLIAGQL
jgi:hypothetical protein